MSFKDKIMNMVLVHPKLVTFAIGFAVTFVIGIAIGMLEHGTVNVVDANPGSKGSSKGTNG
jgi:hypothetical protein